MYKSISKPILTTIEVEKSKFICNLIPVNTEDEAQKTLKNICEKYRDATHNCYAYYIGEGIIQKCSDDGEPAKTAGYPILQALINHNMNNCICIVTRYFGGVKLGTGGLMRAYSASAIESIKNAEIAEYVNGTNFNVTFPYNLSSQIEYILSNDHCEIVSKDYFDVINFNVTVNDEYLDQVLNQINALSCDSVIIDNFESQDFKTRM